MILNSPQIDWITLTTFDREMWSDWLATVYGKELREAEKAKRMQYGGVMVDGVFVGQAIQRKRRHYMLQASGAAADETFPFLSWNRDTVNCTRIDLQVTIDLPTGYSARVLYDGLKEWSGDGKPRQVQLHESGDGLDTVYIGSRQSDRFTRIYVKPLASGNRAIRFETEFKGQHANSVVQGIITDPDNLAGFLAGEITSLPELEFGLSKRFLGALGHNLAVRSKPKRRDELTGGLRWLMNQVHPAMQRLMRDHEVGYTVRGIVRGWARDADEIDDVPF